MSYAQMTLPEFDQEMASTRQVLALVPADKLDWKAHPKLQSIGWNANHVAEIPGWVEGTLQQASWDFNPVGGEPYKTPDLRSAGEIVAFFDRNVAAARKAIEEVRDDELGVMWSLLSGGETILTLPRAAVMRGFILNHLIHHRAFLIAYLRMNDIVVPGMYGP